MEIFEFIIKLLDITIWPFFLITGLFLFKNSLRGLIDRIKKINYKDATILTKMIDQKADAGKIEIDEEIKNTTNEKIENIKDFYSENTVKRFEKNLKDELGISKADNLNKVSSYLYNYSIIKNITSYFKNVYNKIYGSQIELLKKLDNKKQPEDKIKKFYRKTKSEYADIYSNYSFDKYLNYLKSENLIKRKNDSFQITETGRDFIKFIKKKNLSVDKLL